MSLPGSQSQRVAAGLALSFCVFIYPVLHSTNTRDPLANRWTDHQRYRYCAALVLRHPIHALVTPLDQLYAEDAGNHRIVTWGNEPCHEGGLVHVLLHAPIYWALDAERLTDVGASHVYVLFLLLLAHIIVWLLWRGERWWIALLLYPFVVRCALSAAQEPISFLLAILSAQRWQNKQHGAALAYASLAFSSYSRWVTWLVPFVWLIWKDRQTLVPELVADARRRPIVTGALFLCFAWSCVAFVLAALHRPPPGSGTDAVGEIAIWLLIALWAVQWWKHRDHIMPAFSIIGLLFLSFYNGFHMFWYVAPVLAAAPFIAGETEAVLWAIPAIVGSDLFLNREMTTHMGDIARFAWDAWRALF